MKLTTAESVRKAMLAKIAGSLLNEKDAVKLKFKPLTAEQVKKLDVPTAVAGFVIPYFTLDGKPSAFWRMRYLEDTRKGFDILNGRKALRYVQEPGGVNEIYLPPLVDWRKMAENPSVPLMITEGELKAACGTKVGLPTIGLGGVWSFKSNRAKVTLLPMLKLFAWKGRRVVICYDSDAITNQMVVMAENQLARALTDEGAEVFIARLPQEDGEAKVGIDDYLLDHSPEDLMKIMKEASSYNAGFALHSMNENVVYIRNPGIIYDYVNKMRLRPSDFTSHAYANSWHDDHSGEKVVKKQTALAWLQWAHRNELEAVVFEPGQDKTVDNKLNIWDGWPLEPKKGSVRLWHDLMDHLFEGTEPGARKWFEQWCAFPIQNPGQKMTSLVAFWGRVEGSGKSMVAYTLLRLYGEYGAEENDSVLEDERYDWAENKQFVLLDDLTGSANRRLANRMKTMVSQKNLKINPKYVPRYTIRDCANYFCTSNDPDVFFMEDGNRRNFIHEVLAERLTQEFLDRYVLWKDSDDGMAALFYYFLELDLTGFQPFGDAYYTAAKAEMIHLTKSDVAAWVADLKSNEGASLKLPGDLYTAAELLAAYDPMKTNKVTANGMARELKRAGFVAPGENGSMAVTKFGNVRLYAIKNRGFWKKQKTKTVVSHYEQNRTMEPVSRKSNKVKF